MHIGSKIPLKSVVASGAALFDKNGYRCAIVDFGPTYLGIVVTEDGLAAEVTVTGYDRHWVGEHICHETRRKRLEAGLDPVDDEEIEAPSFGF